MKRLAMQYHCTECGGVHQKWRGQCAYCSTWNSLQQKEVPLSPAKRSNDIRTLDQIDLVQQKRLKSAFVEFDRVLGGGLLPGAIILIGGQPGAGKSTLLMQIACHLTQEHNALYVTGEESLPQLALRARRLNLQDSPVQLLAETDIELIAQTMETGQFQLVVIDSIQVMRNPAAHTAAGSVNQVRDCAAHFIQIAKKKNIILLLVGHVTKEGALAGPKVLEHMVDCSLLLESTDDHRFRLLRSHKNRFGAVNELGVFAMVDTGLKEVRNPSSIFLSRSQPVPPGSIVVVIREGSRPLLVELQVLTDSSQMGHARRLAIGVDTHRLLMLLAVLNRHSDCNVAGMDLFANVVGGIKISETAVDLAFALAVSSSVNNRAFPHDTIAFGEIGLSGEIRPVPGGQERLDEAAKHGFKKAIIPKSNLPKKTMKNMHLIGVEHLSAALAAFE